MAWRVWSCDTKTGQKLACIPVAGFPWGTALNMGSSGSATVLLNEDRTKGFDWWSLVDVVRRTLVIEWDGSPMYAGIIWSWDYAYDTKRLTVQHADLWSILTKRILFTGNLSNIEEQKLTMASKSLWDLARGIVEAGTAGSYSLPIFYQGTTGGTRSRTWYGYEMPVVADELEAIMNTAGGPDVVFDPRWSTDGERLEYLMWDGADPGGVVPVNLAANDKQLFDIRVRRDASKVATIMIGFGEGSEEDVQSYVSDPGQFYYPNLVGEASFPTEKDPDVLFDRVDAAHDAVMGPTEQWSASMHASAAFRVTMLKIGRYFEVYSKGDPLILDGYQKLRIIQISGDLTETVKLEFQPI